MVESCLFRAVTVSSIVVCCASFADPAHGQSDRPATDRLADDRIDPPDGRPANLAPVRVPPEVEFLREVVYATTETDDGAVHDLTMNVAFPSDGGGGPLPVIVYIHGGGFVDGDKNIGNQYCVLLGASGYFACTVSYRLAGDARFPAALHDVKAAIRFLTANADELGIDPKRIGVWGHSAGGHLAAFLGTSGNNPETEGEVGPHPAASSNVACVVDFFGTSDLSDLIQRGGRRNDQLVRRLLGDDAAGERTAERLREYSPVAWIDAADPPFLIIHGDRDRVVPLSQSRTLDEKLRESGVASELIVVEGAGHNVNDAEIMLRALAFFDQHLGGRSEEVGRRFLDARPPQRQQRDGAGDTR